MKYLLTSALIVFVPMNSLFGENAPDESNAIARHLAENARHVCLENIGEEISASILVKETDEKWVAILSRLKTTLEKAKLDNRDAILESKQLVQEAWIKERSVFLAKLKSEGGSLHRYNGGPAGGIGYVIVAGTSARYWISL